MNIKELAEKYSPDIIKYRRWYHAHPELSGNEKQTRARIRADLEAMGITDITELDNCYGLTAVIHGNGEGRTVGLRADTDALTVKEETGLPFASEVDGVMHACGHDTHIAMALGAARILNDMKDSFPGSVRMLFQPGEEIAAGARQMIEGGALEGVDALYGAHIWGALDAPLVCVDEGRRMASCHRFTATITGVSAHGSAPHFGIDAITVASSVIGNLQQCVSRMNDPVNPMVLTIGTIHGGDRFNVIPKKVTVEGCVRTFESGDKIERQMRRIIEDTASAFGAKGELEYEYITAPVSNSDPDLNRIAHDAVVKLYGEEGLGHVPALMGSEDFSWYLDLARVPGVFGFIGSRNEEKGITSTNHQETYTVDEDVLKRGAGVMAQFAYDYLRDGD